MGCGIGLRKMGRISGAIKEDALEHAADWHFSHENIVAANDRIVAVMDGLDLPEIYRRQEGQTHTASDGQKFEVSADSLDANRSRSEEHTSELQSLMRISYAVFCLKTKKYKARDH